MKHNASLLYTLLLIMGDFVALVAAFVIAYILRVSLDPRPLVASVASDQYLRIFLTLTPFLILMFASLNLYRHEVFSYRLPETVRLLVGSFISVLLLIGYEFFSGEVIFPARKVALYGFVGAFVLLFIERSLLRWIRRMLYRYRIGVQNVMIIGNTDATLTLTNLLNDTRTSGYDIKAIVGRQEVIPDNFKGEHFHSLVQALEDVDRLGITTLVQTEFFEDPDKNHQILFTAQTKHLAYRFIPTHSEFFTGNHSVELFHGFPVIAVHQTRLLGAGRLFKRGFDVLASLIAIPFMAVAYVVFGIIIKLTDPKGPIIYKSRRITRFKTKFWAYKFRTMYWRYCSGSGGSGKSDAQIFTEMGREDLAKIVSDGDMQIPDDPRVMPIGRFLRATSLDELPQFINIFQGYMSVVGPRAITEQDMRLYQEHGNMLLYMKTGLTGLAQVSGRSRLTYEERAKLNLYYVQNWSVWLDIRILLRTIVAVFSRPGIR